MDDGNEIKPAPPFGYVPEIAFRNLSWMDHLAGSRFPALAGWHKDFGQIFAVMNHVTHQIFRSFRSTDNLPVLRTKYGTVKAARALAGVRYTTRPGSLHMPYKSNHTGAFDFQTIVDQDLRVAGTQNLYVCDMSVMPFSSASNPVRTLVALALRLSRHFG